MTGTVPVVKVLAATAIDRVVLLGGADAEPDLSLQTRDFVRPQWING